GVALEGRPKRTDGRAWPESPAAQRKKRWTASSEAIRTNRLTLGWREQLATCDPLLHRHQFSFRLQSSSSQGSGPALRCLAPACRSRTWLRPRCDQWSCSRRVGISGRPCMATGRGRYRSNVDVSEVSVRG